MESLRVDDPHITIYMGQREEHDYAPHLFKEYPDVPFRLVTPEEFQYDFDGTGRPTAFAYLDRRGLRKEVRAERLLPLQMTPNCPPVGRRKSKASSKADVKITRTITNPYAVLGAAESPLSPRFKSSAETLTVSVFA
ncbi:hypothetical protein BDW66DRAFT_154187 [Aspergillus desertorum]